MAPDREERIRQLAHLIWEREGRPEGREAEHWRLAEQAYDTEASATVAGHDGAAPSQTTAGSSLDVLALGGPQPVPDTHEAAATEDAKEVPAAPARRGRKPKAETAPAPEVLAPSEPDTAPAPKRKRRTKAEMAAAAVAAGAVVAGAAAVAATVVTGKRKRGAPAGTDEVAPATGSAPRRGRKTKADAVPAAPAEAAPEMASDAPLAVTPDTPPEAAPDAVLSDHPDNRAAD